MEKNLIVNISPPKCGTTALFHCLARSQEVAKPRVKEPRFFAPTLGRDVGAVPAQMQLDGKYELGIDWFHDLFNPNATEDFLLDFTTYYSVIHDSPALIKEHYPGAKLFFVTRDPVKRFVSHYYQFVKASVPVPSISEAIAGTSDFGRLMYQFADYKAIYDRFTEVFGMHQICIIKFEDLKSSPKKAEGEISDFLQLSDFDFSPSETEKNVSGRPKSAFLQKVLRGPFAKTLAKAIPAFAYSRILALRKKLILINTQAVANPELSPSDSSLLRKNLKSAYEFLDSLK